MADQTKYLPRTNFSDISQADPAKLDVELAAIQKALDSTQGLLEAILRDDGALRDGLVQLYTLSDVVRKLFSTQINPKGNWDAGQGYAIGDLVSFGDDSFICSAVHVSTADFDADREAGLWVVFSRALQLAVGVVLGTSAERNVGLGVDDVPDIELADARYYRKGRGRIYHETVAGSHILQPGGGANRYSGDFTGAVRIRFPQTWKNAHFRIIVDVVVEGTDPAKKSHSLSALISGRTTSTGTWNDIQGHILDGEKSEQLLPIRYGNDGDAHPCIWLGEINSVWENPAIKIREIMVAGLQTASSMWVEGWSIDFVTAFDTVAQQLNSAGLSQLPDFTSHQGKYIRVKLDGTGFEYRTNLQVATDLSVPLEAPQDGEGYLRYQGGWLPLSSYSFTIENGIIAGDLLVDGGIGSATITAAADSDQAGDELPMYRWLWNGASHDMNLSGAVGGGLLLQDATNGVLWTIGDNGDLAIAGDFAANNIDGQIIDGVSVRVAGQEVYHPGNKPGYADVGAMPAGGTVTLSGNASGNATFNAAGDMTLSVTVSQAANADTVDGVHASSLMRSDANDNKTAGYTRFNDSIEMQFGSGGDAQVFHNGSNLYLDNDTGVFYIRNGTTTRFELHSSGLFRADNDVVAFYSDERLKNISGRPDSCLADVLAWRVIRYTPTLYAAWASRGAYDPTKVEVSVSAQSVQANTPEAIEAAPFDRDEDGNSISGEHFLTVKERPMIAKTAGAIQELAAIVEKQQQQILSLQKQLLRQAQLTQTIG